MTKGRARTLTRIRYACVVAAFLAVVAISPLRLVTIEGQSMEPTLRPGHTYLLDQLYWRRGGLRRGDIVVIDHGEEKWVKRLVGLPRDRLQLVFVPWGDISAIHNLTAKPGMQTNRPLSRIVELAPDEIFVIGDNLNRSRDSTSPQEAGSFKVGDIVGVVRRYNFSRNFPFRTPADEPAQ